MNKNPVYDGPVKLLSGRWIPFATGSSEALLGEQNTPFFIETTVTLTDTFQQYMFLCVRFCMLVYEWSFLGLRIGVTYIVFLSSGIFVPRVEGNSCVYLQVSVHFQSLVGSWHFKDLKRWNTVDGDTRLRLEFSNLVFQFQLEDKGMYKEISDTFLSCTQTNWQVSRLIGWLIDWLTGWFNWLVDWLIDWMIGWLIGRLIDWSVDWLIDWLIGWLIGRLIDWLIDWLTIK